MARVLIIDDSPDMQDMLRLFFERRTDFEVMIAANGKQGLSMAFEQPPQLALVDVMMPGMDGYEVVRRLRDHPATSEIGIIILTARGQPVDQAAAMRAGADLHLSKPVNIDTLSDAITSLLSAPENEGTSRAIVPVLGLRGGIGVTTLAVNLAVLFQQAGPTVLWDLSPSSGHAALFLGLPPRTHWGQVLRDTTKSINSLLREHRSGLRLLGAPPIPGMFGWFDETQIEVVLMALMEIAQFLVIDMPPILDGTISPIIERAEKVLLVTGDDPPAIQTTLATLQALQRWQARPIVTHNVNRPGKGPDVAALERAMRISIPCDIPYDPHQRLTLGKGVPLALAKPDSPLVTQLKKVAKLLLTD